MQDESRAIPLEKAVQPKGFVAARIVRTHALNLADVVRLAAKGLKDEPTDRTSPMRGEVLFLGKKRAFLNRDCHGRVSIILEAASGDKVRCRSCRDFTETEPPRIPLDPDDVEKLVESLWNMQDEVKRVPPEETDEYTESADEAE